MNFKILFLVLCFHFTLMRADITHSLYYAEDIPSNCTKVLDSFAEHAMSFTKCSIQNARPIKLCENCIDHYVNFISKYDELSNTRVNGTSCLSFYVSLDRLDVVLQYYDSIMYVWEKGNCNECFTWNGPTPIISVATQTFNKKYDETMKCIHDNANTNSTVICTKCQQSYIQLDNYYKSLSSDKIGVDSVCVDIVDSMNKTRSLWSKTYECCKLRKSPEIIFLACSGIISFLPFLYYFVVRYAGPIRELPNAMKQSRFKQRLLRTGNTRIN